MGAPIDPVPVLQRACQSAVRAGGRAAPTLNNTRGGNVRFRRIGSPVPDRVARAAGVPRWRTRFQIVSEAQGADRNGIEQQAVSAVALAVEAVTGRDVLNWRGAPTGVLTVRLLREGSRVETVGRDRVRATALIEVIHRSS